MNESIHFIARNSLFMPQTFQTPYSPRRSPLAIQFHADGYSMSGKIMGRQSAGNGFLNGWLRYADVDAHHAWVPDASAAKLFNAFATENAVTQPVHVFGNAQLSQLKEVGCLYLPGPGLSTGAWQRSVFGQRAWSLLGVTFTTCSDRSMNEFADFLTAPVAPWDALMCSSRAVRDSVRKVLEGRMDYLRNRLGATRFSLPQLPIVPFGVHEEEFAFTAAQKSKAKAELGCTANSVVVLFAGRLSFHAKAHPLAMFQALQAIAVAHPEKDIVMLEFGVFFNEGIKAAFEEAATKVAPNVRRVVLDGKSDGNKLTAWAGADIFCSLTDNIQEAFGITPVEAMAAGLPVVVTDWDGYKDTVVDGVTGYLIPTVLPPAGDAQDIAHNHALETISYDVYIGQLSAITHVHLEAAKQALTQLVLDAALRARMGAAGQARVAQQYSWRGIIAQYQQLIGELNENRRSYPTLAPEEARNAWPVAIDPLHAFGSYPSSHLAPQTELRLARSDAASWFALAADLNMNSLAKAVVLPRDALAAGITFVAKTPNCTAAALQGFWVGNDPRIAVLARRSIMHLLKLGVLST